MNVPILTASQKIDTKEFKKRSGQRLNVNEDELREFHKTGASTFEIMKKFHIVNDLMAKNLLKKLGLEPNKSNQSKISFDLFQAHRPWATPNNLHKLYVVEQKSIREISGIYKSDENTVTGLLQRFNVPLRTHQEAVKLVANTVKGRETRSRISKELWQNDDIRSQIIAKLRDSHPQMPPDHAEHVSQAMKLLYEDDEFYQRHKHRMTMLWRNPTEKMLQNLQETAEALRNDTELRQKFLTVVRTDEHRDNLSAKATQMWNDETFLKEKLPELKRKCSEAAKQAWQDPIYREAVMSKKKFTSSLELIVHDLLRDMGIKHRKICPAGCEFDIAIEPEDLKQDRGVLIEINGLYYHRDGEKDHDKFLFWKEKLSDRYRFETIWEYEFGAYSSLYNRVIEILGIGERTTHVELSDLAIEEIDSVSAEQLYNKYHYLGKIRRGYHIGAKFNGKLIAAATFSVPTRKESIIRLQRSYDEVRELARFCINRTFHNPNLASFLMPKFLTAFSKRKPNVTTIISFSDPQFGHLGTIYKATNWRQDGQTSESYHYVKDGNSYDKRKTYRYARSLNLTEREFCNQYGFEKIREIPKLRFIYDLQRSTPQQ